MATILLLEWQEFEPGTDIVSRVHRCEIKARNDEDALFMDVMEQERQAVSKRWTVSAYYRFEDRRREIPLYDDFGFDNVDDAKEALTQWYVNHAPTLLITLAA